MQGNQKKICLQLPKNSQDTEIIKHALQDAGYIVDISQTPSADADMVIKTVSQSGLNIDFAGREVTVNGKEVKLTPNEFKILSLLAKNKGVALSHEKIINEVWGPYNSDSLVLRVNIANIRKKIEKNHKEPEFILTMTGVGYKMAE